MRFEYTLVSSPHGLLTRRYATTAATRLVVTTPTAHRGLCIICRMVELGLTGCGIITDKAVMLFSSSLRCGGLRRVAPPMR